MMQKHVVHVMANNTTAPYLNWLAERVHNYKNVRFSFINLFPEKPLMIEQMKKYGCNCYWIKYDCKHRKSNMIYAFFKLFFLIRKIKPDAIHTHLFDDSLPSLLAARLAGIRKRIITKGDTGYHWYFKPQWIWADRFNNYNATDIVAISNESMKFIIENEKADASKVYMIHHGIPLEMFMGTDIALIQKLKREYKLEGKTVIGTISKLIEWKGYSSIIEAAKIIIKENTNIKFLFIGTGPQENELRELIRKNNLNEYITLTGWINPSYIPSMLDIFDIGIHAAFMEPFGFVLVETMAKGVPLVTTKTGAAAEVLTHKDNCYFATYNDPLSFADGIKWMLMNFQLREQMKSQLKNIANQYFSVERMLNEYVKLYLS